MVLGVFVSVTQGTWFCVHVTRGVFLPPFVTKESFTARGVDHFLRRRWQKDPAVCDPGSWLRTRVAGRLGLVPILRGSTGLFWVFKQHVVGGTWFLRTPTYRASQLPFVPTMIYIYIYIYMVPRPHGSTFLWKSLVCAVFSAILYIIYIYIYIYIYTHIYI